MIDDWRHALAALDDDPPRLVVKRPPEWWYTTRVGQLVARTGANGRVAIEITPRVVWPRLLVIDRQAALDPAAALTTGDDRFDRAVAVYCDAPFALGLLDQTTRQRLSALVADGGSVIAGVVCPAPAQAPAALDDALALARALSLTPAEASAQLVAIASSDPIVAVRHHYLDVAQAHDLATSGNLGKTRQQTFDKLAAELTSTRASRAQRMAALEALLLDHTVAAVVDLPVRWDALVPGGNDAVQAALHDAYGRDPSATLDLVQQIYAGRLDELPDTFADALIELMPLAMTTASLTQWFQLAHHANKRLALSAVDRIGSLPDGLEAFMAALRDPGLNGQLTRHDELTRHLLTVAIVRYLDATDPERVATRRFVRTFGGRHVLAPGAGFVDQWPATRFALDMIAAHHEADDPEAGELYRMLVDHDDVKVRRRALVGFLDQASAEPIPTSALTADIVAAALDPSGPRHGGKVLVRHFPRDNRPAQIQFLDAFARVGTTEHLPFLLEFLDDDDSAIVCRALKAIGNIADPSVVPRLKPLTSGFFRDGDVKDAASAAIEAIQARGAPRGALSMSDAGGLALEEED